jgi:hypothetical protein
MKTGRVGVIYVLSLYRLSFYIRSLFAYHRILSLGGGGVLLTFNFWTPSAPDQINYITLGTAQVTLS